ncbi:MAG: pseudouridine synthase [Spirochaetaceae bacterium]
MEQRRELTILFQDEDILIVDKPPGMLVHRNAWDPHSPTCVNALAGMVQRRVYNIHRLDRGTSGVLVFALSQESAKAVADAFRDRLVDKRYIAVVRGHLDKPRTVDTPLREKNGKVFNAVTHVTPLSSTVVPEPIGPYEEGWFSLVEMDLETGRRHQARRHLNYVAHPVIGDKQHGDSRNNRFFAERFGVGELLLRAVSLEFPHPRSGETVRAFAGLPSWWKELLTGVGFDPPEKLLRKPSIEVGATRAEQ